MKNLKAVGLLGLGALLTVANVYADCADLSGKYLVKSADEGEFEYVYLLEQTGCEELRVSLMNGDTPVEIFGAHFDGAPHDTKFNTIPPWSKTQLTSTWASESSAQIEFVTVYKDSSSGSFSTKRSRQVLRLLADGNIASTLERLEPTPAEGQSLEKSNTLIRLR